MADNEWRIQNFSGAGGGGGGALTPEFGAKTYCYWPQQSWAKAMFLQASVILSTGGGVCLSACWDATCHPGADPPRSRHPPSRHPPEQTPPQSRPPRADTPPSRHTPLEQTPQRRHPPGTKYTPPEADSGIRSTSGRYASYCNAFLFDKIFAENCMKMKGIGPRSADVVCFEQEDTTVTPKSVSSRP